MDAKGEVMLTILSSLSQEESKSISEKRPVGTAKEILRRALLHAVQQFPRLRQGA